MLVGGGGVANPGFPVRRVRIATDGVGSYDGDASSVNGSEAAMWRDGIVDWIVLGFGYLLALGLFAWLGGASRAADAIRHWGRLASTTPKEER
jgi:hypothetical protein